MTEPPHTPSRLRAAMTAGADDGEGAGTIHGTTPAHNGSHDAQRGRSHEHTSSIKRHGTDRHMDMNGADSSPGLDGERGHIRSTSPRPDETDSHEESLHGRGHGLRVDKQRRARGFLLPSAHRHSSTRKRLRGDAKGKEKAAVNGNATHASSSTSASGPGSHLTTPVRSSVSMRSSPLAQVVVSPRPMYGDGTSSRPSMDLDSTPRSDASSSQPRASSDYTLGADGDTFGQQQHAGIDAAQIVSMALNLSEGRRRHMSASQLLQQQAGGARRSTSAAIPSPGMLQGSYQNAGVGGSLRQALNQQKRGTRNQSPSSAGKGSTGRHTSATHSFLPSEPSDMQYANQDLFYRFTPSTLARAEKARQYIELSVEYRRLLDFLPPLKPDITAPGNYEFQTFSVPGTPSVQLTRSPTTTTTNKYRHKLGRSYNPLQMIRNRKLRMRNRISLQPDSEQFAIINVVQGWLDEVQDFSTRPGYRSEDRVQLPIYPETGSFILGPDASPTHHGHQRTDSTMKPKLQRIDWSFVPSEQLADAYWMELDSNKRLIENRLGNKIFPPLRDVSGPQPRASYESRRSHHSHVGSVATTTGSLELPDHDEDDEKESTRGRGHNFRIHRRDESHGRLKQVWHKARRRSRSSSSGLSSSDEGPLGPAKGRKALRTTQTAEMTGPLEKHMNHMLDAQSQNKSPDLVSPGTPNKWGTVPAPKDGSQPRAQAGAPYANKDPRFPENATQDTGRKDVQKFSPDSVNGRHAGRFDSRSSFEDFASTGPNSPVLAAHLPPIGMDLSPAGSRAASPPRRLGKPLLPFIRHEHHRNQRKGSSGDDGNQSSRQVSAEVESNARNSLEVPPTTERIRLHRHKTSDGIQDLTLKRENTERDTKEPQSAMRRFFKGGRIGEIVRSEGVRVTGRGRRQDLPQDGSGPDRNMHSDTDSTEYSDTEGADLNFVRSRPAGPQRSNTGWSQKYNSDKLPSFRSARASDSQQYGVDHISSQRRELLRNRSSKLDTLAPPSLDLSRVGSSTSNFADISRTDTRASESSRDDRRNAHAFAAYNRNRSRLGTRLEAILDVSGTVGAGGLPVTGLSELSNEKPPSRPRPKANRQWSISDKPRSRSRDNRAPTLDLADIERVRALLMCSGIKASSIGRRAIEPRDPPAFLRKAAETANALPLMPVKRREEHVLAAKLLTTHLETETSALHDDADRFLSQTGAKLRQDLHEMKEIVNSAIKTAQDLGDSCVGFGSEVTGQRTLQVRQVVEQLEKLARTRRRRMRWVRRVGFGLVEWAVVLFMWWIWLIVMVCKMILNVFRAAGCTIKWVLWL